MSIIFLLIAVFVILTIISKLFNILKFGLVIAIILMIATPSLINLKVNSDIFSKVTNDKVNIVATTDVSTFKVVPHFEGDKSLFLLSPSEIKKGPESITIYYNEENLDKIPSEIREKIEKTVQV